MASTLERLVLMMYRSERSAAVLERSELLPMGCRALPMDYRAPSDLVMASEAELVKRSALVMKTHTSMKVHLVLPQHLQPTCT